MGRVRLRRGKRYTRWRVWYRQYRANRRCHRKGGVHRIHTFRPLSRGEKLTASQSTCQHRPETKAQKEQKTSRLSFYPVGTRSRHGLLNPIVRDTRTPSVIMNAIRFSRARPRVSVPQRNVVSASMPICIQAENDMSWEQIVGLPARVLRGSHPIRQACPTSGEERTQVAGDAVSAYVAASDGGQNRGG